MDAIIVGSEWVWWRNERAWRRTGGPNPSREIKFSRASGDRENNIIRPRDTDDTINREKPNSAVFGFVTRQAEGNSVCGIM